jgi:2-haloacid dehalogenase
LDRHPLEKPPRIAVFDIGNVLLGWDPDALYRNLIADEHDRRRFLETVCNSEWNLAQDAGRSFADGVAALSALWPDKADLIRAYDERWHETITGVIEDSVTVLKTLQEKGVRTFAITNFNQQKFAECFERYAFLRSFEGIVVSGAERVLKPDRAIYDLLCARYGLEAGECFFIDDSRKNVEGARLAGMWATQYTSSRALRVDLRSAGFPV